MNYIAWVGRGSFIHVSICAKEQLTLRTTVKMEEPVIFKRSEVVWHGYVHQVGLGWKGDNAIWNHKGKRADGAELKHDVAFACRAFLKWETNTRKWQFLNLCSDDGNPPLAQVKRLRVSGLLVKRLIRLRSI